MVSFSLLLPFNLHTALLSQSNRIFSTYIDFSVSLSLSRLHVYVCLCMLACYITLKIEICRPLFNQTLFVSFDVKEFFPLNIYVPTAHLAFCNLQYPPHTQYYASLRLILNESPNTWTKWIRKNQCVRDFGEALQFRLSKQTDSIWS